MTSCECTLVDSAVATIPPAGELPVELRLNLTQYEPSSGHGDFAVDLILSVEQTAPPQRFTLEGRVLERPFVVDGGQLELGELVHSDLRAFQHVIPLRTNDDLGLLRAECLPEAIAQITVRPAQSPATGIDLDLALRDSLPLGPLNFDVRLHFDDGTGRTILLNLPVSGDIVHDIEATPRAIALGALPVGESIDQHVTFRSRTGRAILSAVAADAPEEFDLSQPAPREGDPSQFVSHVQGRAVLPGSQQIDLNFTFELEGLDSPIVVTVPLEYYGLETVEETL